MKILITVLIYMFAFAQISQGAWWVKLGGVASVADSGPVISGEVGSSVVTSNSLSTNTTATDTVAVGEAAIVIISTYSTAALSVTGVTDSAGNVYVQDASYVWNSRIQVVYSSILTSAISIGDTISVSWSSAQYGAKLTTIVGASGVSSVDATASNNAYGSAPTIPGTTTANDTILVGTINTENSTYDTSNWTIGHHEIQGSHNTYAIYTTETTAGTKDPGGSIPVNKSWGGVWVAYK